MYLPTNERKKLWDALQIRAKQNQYFFQSMAGIIQNEMDLHQQDIDEWFDAFEKKLASENLACLNLMNEIKDSFIESDSFTEMAEGEIITKGGRPDVTG